MSEIDYAEFEDDDEAFEADEKVRIAALHKSAPEVIWLQIDPEAEQFDGWEAQTWCSDKINETDVKYVRADQLAAERERCAVQLETLVYQGELSISEVSAAIHAIRSMSK